MDKTRGCRVVEECYLSALSSENNQRSIIAVSYNQDIYEFRSLRIDNLDKVSFNVFSMINCEPLSGTKEVKQAH